MKTRTLLLLAVACGLAILVAGSIQLLRITDSPSPSVLAVGESATVADLTVTVEAVDEVDDVLTVRVRLGGVDDSAAVTDGFRLVLAGQALEPNGPSGPEDCAGATVAETRCDIRFGVAEARGSARVLVVRRGDEQARWQLAAGE